VTDGAVIKLAILAVGGQGGGVLTGWIEALARASGYVVQATSVAGVAQRTGATIYYVEMSRASRPVLALMPAAGDVDIMITAEMMEAGRAILRGFVTPDRTTLITSTHRALAVSEKVQPGDGIANADEVMAAAQIAARRLIAADFNAVALEAGSVISAALFGALAASGALPFAITAYEDAIRGGGKGAEASLQAFHAGHAAALTEVVPAKVFASPRFIAKGPAGLMRQWHDLQARVGDLPAPVQAMAMTGLRKVVEFQDPAYGAEYLDRLVALLRLDRADKSYALTEQAAKYLANAMAYDDVIRVADLKSRAARVTRIGAEMGLGAGKVMQVTDYFHPRAEEVIGLLPHRLGRRIAASPTWSRRIGRWFDRGWHLRSDGLTAFVMLYLIGGQAWRRRRTFRHAQELAHLEHWLALACAYLPRDYDLAVEVIRCRRLIKGYSDTHARGLSKYDLVLQGAAQVAGRPDAADWVRRLRDAALLDEEGKALAGALKTIQSFAGRN
jgi:indolepyruvate ferredoxin oxidoreductase beta subunit